MQEVSSSFENTGGTVPMSVPMEYLCAGRMLCPTHVLISSLLRLWCEKRNTAQGAHSMQGMRPSHSLQEKDCSKFVLHPYSTPKLIICVVVQFEAR